MSKEQIEEMIESYKRLENMRKIELEVSQFHVKMATKMLEVHKERNEILTEILSVLKGDL